MNILYDPSHFVLQQPGLPGVRRHLSRADQDVHVKDAEFNPTGRQGAYGGYQPWVDRAGRFRSLGDGQVDFNGIFSRLAAHGFRGLGGAGVGVLPQTSGGRRPGGSGVYQAGDIIRVTDHAFDDFAGCWHKRGCEPPHARHRVKEVHMSTHSRPLGRRLRLGMVGGGGGAFIGAVHRIAARMDDRYELVAGALASDPDRSRASAEASRWTRIARTADSRRWRKQIGPR